MRRIGQTMSQTAAMPAAMQATRMIIKTGGLMHRTVAA